MLEIQTVFTSKLLYCGCMAFPHLRNHQIVDLEDSPPFLSDHLVKETVGKLYLPNLMRSHRDEAHRGLRIEGVQSGAFVESSVFLANSDFLGRVDDVEGLLLFDVEDHLKVVVGDWIHNFI